jgi:hypothetical protein
VLIFMTPPGLFGLFVEETPHAVPLVSRRMRLETGVLPDKPSAGFVHPVRVKREF